ncbi:hypothetical protein CIK91_04360 [Segatella bryantii]|uniref:Uncharacterized protein n=1 Tax=Segatella bryantii TaxID=77095 RepID=A0ABX4EIP6_SEGBR|nr:hypothetical protein CIK91_04360 [Segatella bryantii]
MFYLFTAAKVHFILAKSTMCAKDFYVKVDLFRLVFLKIKNFLAKTPRYKSLCVLTFLARIISCRTILVQFIFSLIV